MRRPLTTPIFWLFMVVALLAGGTLIAAAAWLRPLMEAQQALHEGQFDLSRQRYAVAEARFAQVPVTAQAVPALYRLSIDNQLFLLYRQGRYDAVLEKAAVSPSTPTGHFWAGCASYQKALAEEKNEAKMPWLGRAQDEFKKSIELDRTSWDAEYDFELSKRLLNELKKQPKTPPKQMMQLLRPQPQVQGQPVKRVG